MKKKTLAILSAVMVLAMSSITVSAAEPEVGTVNPPDEGQVAVTAIEGKASPEEYLAVTSAENCTISAASQQTIDSAMVAIQNNLLNHLADISNSSDTGSRRYLNYWDIAADPTAKVTATILSVVKVDNISTVPFGRSESYFSLNVGGTTEGDMIVVLSYNGSEWFCRGVIYDNGDVLPYQLNYYFGYPEEDGTIFFRGVNAVEAVVVVSIDVSTVTDAPAADTTATETPATDTTVADVPQTDTTETEAPTADTTDVEIPVADATPTASPQTGEAVPMAAVVIMVGLTGAVICGKKYFA